MKILLAHNYYGSSAPSGENEVFHSEKELLSGQGNKLISFTRHSDDIRSQGAWGAMRGGFSTPWNVFSFLDLKRVVRSEQPTVLHVHNFFPLLSPSIFYAAHSTRTATVLTLHNYRLFCPAAIPLRNGAPCTKCIDGHCVLPSLVYGCYRGSRIASLPLAAMIALHRRMKTWFNQVDAFIALTDFQKKVMVHGGLPEERVFVKPHFYPDPPAPLLWHERKNQVLYIGRLSEEKGVRHLIKAWTMEPDSDLPELTIIGDGPLRRELVAMVAAAGADNRIHFLGQLPFREAQANLARAKLLVLPSVWFEGFPMVIREAFALGVPVAASNLGSMPCLVKDGVDGVLFAPGDAGDLLEKVSALWNDQEGLARKGGGARAGFEEQYTAEANYKMLMEIYSSAMETRAARLNTCTHC